MVRSAKRATPSRAAMVVEPPSVLPVPELPPNATVTFPVKLGTAFPSGSSAVTCTGGASAAPAMTVVGCTGDVGRAAGQDDGAEQPGGDRASEGGGISHGSKPKARSAQIACPLFPLRLGTARPGRCQKGGNTPTLGRAFQIDPPELLHPRLRPP